MIRSQTVFVLGAGASQAYRFPDGESLVRLAIDFTETEGMPGKVAELQALGIDEARAQGFRDQLAKSLVESIDAFLETRQEFLDIGKRVIARLLMPLEQPDYLPAREDDWYAYLLNRMIKGSPDDFRANRLSVVTFNFDRSFEWALFTTLQARYGLSDDEAGDLASSVKVIHVHGDLGQPSRRPGGPPAGARASRTCTSTICAGRQARAGWRAACRSTRSRRGWGTRTSAKRPRTSPTRCRRNTTR